MMKSLVKEYKLKEIVDDDLGPALNYLRLLPARFLQYQYERFPVKKYAPLVAAFAGSGLALSYMVTGESELPNLPMYVTAFSVAFLVFVQLRISDEIKDAHFDRQYHPDRPVPRGLVKLNELKLIGWATVITQSLIVIAFDLRLFIPLSLTWSYLFLMHNEFFVGGWLKKHQVFYMLSHMGILFFTDLFITACHWMVSNQEPGFSLIFFFCTSFNLGMVIEIGRKIKSPDQEIVGANTYSASWGTKSATLIWLATIFSSLIFAVLTATQVGFGFQAAFISALMFVACFSIAVRFLNDRTSKQADKIESISGLWTLSVYLLVGIAPLLNKLLVSL